MLSRFLSCRERFRLKYILGLEPRDTWNHRLGYGNMWHECEQAHAAGTDWHSKLHAHTIEMCKRYPLQADEILKWYSVCKVQFPEYVKYWAEEPDVKNRTPLRQEQVFDVPYRLPSGRVVRLRGKWDSVDLIREETEGLLGRHKQVVEGVWQQENKTKADVDKLQIERQLKFDLQTMFYHVALENLDLEELFAAVGGEGDGYPLLGVRYNVVRRPLSGGRGNISPHKAKYVKGVLKTPAETMEQFYERLRHDYLAADPDYWFFRVRVEVSAHDVEVFSTTCLDPLLETVCIWYEQLTGRWDKENNPDAVVYGSDAIPPMNYRTPFGVYSALEEGGATEYDAYLATGSEAGLRRGEALFPELQ